MTRTDPEELSPLAQATLNLIAAAPDLLAALKGLVVLYDCDDRAGLRRAVDEARAAIAKAEARDA